MKFPFNQVFMKQQQSFLFVILTFKTICLSIQDLSILEDANNLLIHHVKRQTSIHKEDKHKIKVLLKHFLMDRFKHARQDLSDDEREDEDDSGKEEVDAESDPGKGASRGSKKKPSKDETSPSNKKEDAKESEDLDVKVEPKDGRRTPLHVRDMDPVIYKLFFYLLQCYVHQVYYLSSNHNSFMWFKSNLN